MDYDYLIAHINGYKTDKEKLKFISSYIIKNIRYNYEYLDNSKVSKYLINNDPDSVVDFNNSVEVIKFVEQLSSDLKLTESYKHKILELYHDLYNSGCYIEFLNIIPSVSAFRYENGVLKMGVCQQISEFFNKLCKDAGLDSKMVRGNTGFAHQWNIVKINGQDLHYDCTYAIYSRDGYRNGDKKTTPKDWLGITEEQLKKLDNGRKIDCVM